MKKAATLGLFLAVLLVSPVYAGSDAGNSTCPVSGDEVSGKDFVEVAGKNYGLCCAMCATKLAHNPEKYLGEDTQTQSHDHSHA